MEPCIALVLVGVKQIKRRGLTIRSTGPIAAGRHLGYKSLAQIPARRNRPVSSNVSHQTDKSAQVSPASKYLPLQTSTRIGLEDTKTVEQFAFAIVHEGVGGSKVSCWLALRAGVLRRAAS